MSNGTAVASLASMAVRARIGVAIATEARSLIADRILVAVVGIGVKSAVGGDEALRTAGGLAGAASASTTGASSAKGEMK